MNKLTEKVSEYFLGTTTRSRLKHMVNFYEEVKDSINDKKRAEKEIEMLRLYQKEYPLVCKHVWNSLQGVNLLATSTAVYINGLSEDTALLALFSTLSIELGRNLMHRWTKNITDYFGENYSSGINGLQEWNKEQPDLTDPRILADVDEEGDEWKNC